MARKELLRFNWVYLISGVALLLALAAVVYLVSTWGNVTVNPNRYDLTNDFNKQQFDNLVAAHTTLKSGFNFDAATAQASALFALGDYKETEKAWRYFIVNRPRAIQGYWGLGDIYSLEKRYEDAEKNFLKAIEVDTSATYASSFIKLSNLYLTALPDKSYKLVQILVEAMAKNPTEPNYPLLLAGYYKSIDDKPSAIRFYEKVLELNPDAATANSIKQEINALKS